MIETTAGLVHRRGFHGTSLNEILTESGAPRGSLYYHFPGGKEELVLQAARQGVAMVTQLLKEVLAGSPDPAEGVRSFVEAAAHMLRDSDYVFGCPVAPIVLDSPESSALAEVCQDAFEEWRQVLAGGLGSGGIERERAESLATVVVCALEGGLLLARARRDIAPLDAIAEELASMVQYALLRSTPP
ncbi:MAG TPA: TetR/AcrR family transcriptional regulator [Rubrobacteraceae bacterium]|nr:TetR/AcrR family transcriptional regulator [Rubrobacteraceae bacterium]